MLDSKFVNSFQGAKQDRIAFGCRQTVQFIGFWHSE